MPKAYGPRLASEIADVIAEAALKVPDSPLKKILLYGSIVNVGMGSDIDLILEVEMEAFQNYTGLCMVVLDGVHPFSEDLLEPHHSAAFDYFSPKGPRSKAALKTIGVAIEKLHFGVLESSLDIVCLPEGWDDVKSQVHRDLKDALRTGRDPQYLEHVMYSKLQVFPKIAMRA